MGDALRRRGRPPKRAGEKRRATIALRIRHDLRRSIEEEAARNQRSLSEEAEARLERSFGDDAAFGGAEVRKVILMIATSFAHNGALQALALGRADWQSGGWMKDGGCYQVGMMAAVEALLGAQPNADWPKIKLQLSQIGARMHARYGVEAKK